MTDRKAEIRARLAKANGVAPFENWKYTGYDVDPCDAHYREEDNGYDAHEPVDCPTRECVFNSVEISGMFTEEMGDFMGLHPHVAMLVEHAPSDLEWALNRIDELEKKGNQLVEAMDLIAMRYHESGEICWCSRDACFHQGSALADCRKANDAIKRWKEAKS